MIKKGSNMEIWKCGNVKMKEQMWSYESMEFDSYQM